MSGSIWEPALAIAALFGLLMLLAYAAIEKPLDTLITWIQLNAIRLYVRVLNWRTDRLMRKGMRDALKRGWIDERGNVIKRDEYPRDGTTEI